MEDAAIVALFWSRDEDAIRQSQNKYSAMLLGISESLTGSRTDAEECVNDALLAAWNAIPPAKPEKLGAYFAKLVRRISISRYRSAHAEKRGGFLIETELTDAIPDSAQQDPAERELEKGMLTETVNRFLKELPQRKRVAFVLRYFYGKSVEEVAKETGMRTSNVKVTLMRTREALRKILEKEGLL